MKLNYQITEFPDPLAEPIVLLHGLFGKQDNLGLLKQALQLQRPVITVDLRNHGLSEWHAEMNYQVMCDDILNLLSELALPKAHLLGHSMGGKVAMAVALQAPDRVASLCVADIAPVTYTESRHTNVFKALNAVANAQVTSRKEAEQLMSDYLAEPSVRQFLLKSFSNEQPTHWQFNLHILQQHYADIMGWPFATQHYSGPVLFIKGGASDYLQTEHQPAIRQHFPNASAKIIPGCGHWLHAEKPLLFNGIVERFLQQPS
ncbi:alpha/beta fold hydrolase [uncultured Tolumonas sp.]|uniref:alpha/beta fold hydrolase n=1 Tax=uncultured Tolumonas sp. TaxID=263765 RepID=UPI002930DB73|nr:alpha/beta fold hydrolase [uncultured Tolumonas sp.]